MLPREVEHRAKEWGTDGEAYYLIRSSYFPGEEIFWPETCELPEGWDYSTELTLEGDWDG